MHAQLHRASARARLDPVTLAWGGLLIATTDFLFCLAFWLPLGSSVPRLLQSVAAGALGRDAFAGGWPAAALGAGFMWLIGTMFVGAYALAAQRLDTLRRHAARQGPLYGLVLYLVMLRVVVPLSAAPPPAQASTAWTLACLPMFAVFGTLAAVLGARAVMVRR